MTGPKRIQRKRTKGWRMPEGAVYVGRPTAFGNPFRQVGAAYYTLPDGRRGAHILHTRQWATRAYRSWMTGEWASVYRHYVPVDRSGREDPRHGMFLGDVAVPMRPGDLSPLRGRDLACWCPLDQPCHADVLLELANAGATS